jgi:hypothetical protein
MTSTTSHHELDSLDRETALNDSTARLKGFNVVGAREG